MDKFSGNFKKPRSSIGKRNQRASLSGHNDSRLETISESSCPTPSTSRLDSTITADESLPLGYDSLCDETLRTPSSHKFASGDHLKTPKFMSQLRYPSGLTTSYKKNLQRNKPECKEVKSVKLQTTKEVDVMATPPHVLRKRLNMVSSVYCDLEEEYKELQDFTTLEKQILSVEGYTEVTSENHILKGRLMLVSKELQSLKEKLGQYESRDIGSLQAENFSLKEQVLALAEESCSLRAKLEETPANNELTSVLNENASLKEQLNSMAEESNNLREKIKELSSNIDIISLQDENASLKEQLNTLTQESNELKEKLKESSALSDWEGLQRENQELKTKCDELTTSFSEMKSNIDKLSVENKTVLKKYENVNNKLIELEMVSDAKVGKWNRREAELLKSLQESWDLLADAGVKNDTISEKVSQKNPIDSDQLKFLQGILSEKINIINSLQHKISILESSFVSNIDGKNVVISALTEKVKFMSNQFSIWSNKMLVVESNLVSKESNVSSLIAKLESVKSNSVKHLLKLKESLTNESFNDVESITAILKHLEIIVGKLNSGEVSCDYALEVLISKLICLAQDLVGLKKNNLSVSSNISSKVDSLLLEIQESKKTVENISTELTEKQSKIESLSSTLSDKENKIENLVFDLNEKEKDIKSFDLKIKNLSSELISKEHEIEKIVNDINLKNGEIENLNQKCSKFDHLVSEMSDKDNKIESLLFDLKEKDREITSFLSRVGDEESKIVVLKTDLADKEIEIQKFVTSLQEYKTKVDSFSAELNTKDNMVENLSSELAKKMEDIEKLKDDLSERDKNIEKLTVTLTDFENKIAEVTLIHKEQSEKVVSFDTVLDEKNSKIECLLSDLTEKENKISLLVSDVENLNSKVETLSIDLNDRESKIKLLLSDLNEREVNIDNLKCTVDEYQTKIDTLTSGLCGENNKSEKFVLDIKEKESVIDNLIHDLSEKESQIESSLSDIKEKDFKIQFLLSNLKEKELKISNLESCMEEKDIKFNSLLSEIAMKESRSEELSATLKEEQEKLDECLRVILSKDATLDKYSATISEKESKIIDLSEKLSEKDIKLVTLKDDLEKNASHLSEVTSKLEENDNKLKYLMHMINEIEGLSNNRFEDVYTVLNDLILRFKQLSSELNSKDGIVINFSSELNLKELRLNEVVSELDKANVKLEELTSALNEKVSIMDNLVFQLELKDNRIDELLNMVENKNYELLHLNGVVCVKNGEVMELTNRLDKLNGQTGETSAKMTDEINSLLSEKQQLNYTLACTVNELNTAKTQCFEKDLKLNFIKTELEKSFELMDSLSCRIALNDKIISDNKKTYDNLINSYKDKVEVLSNEVKTLNCRIIDDENRLKDLASDVCLCDGNDISFENSINSIQLRFSELNDLLEHYKNMISSKNLILAKRAKNYELSRKEMAADKDEFEQKLNEVEKSYEDILSKTMGEINLIQSLNESQRVNLNKCIQDLHIQLESKSNELSNKDEVLTSLTEDLSIFNNERKEYFDKLESFGVSIIASCDITNYNDSLNFIAKEFERFKDLIEHLRNVIESKQEKIALLSKEIRSVSNSKVEEMNRISSLQNSIILLNEKLQKESSNRTEEFYVDHLTQTCALLELGSSSDLSFNDVVVYLEKKLTESSDLIEHLKNVINSKEEQMVNVNDKLAQKQYIITDLQTRLSTVVDDFSSKSHEIQDLELQNSTLSKELNSTSSELNSLRHNLKQLINNSLFDTSDDLINSLKTKLNDLDQLCEHLKNTIQSKDEKIMKLLSTVKYKYQRMVIDKELVGDEENNSISPSETNKELSNSNDIDAFHYKITGLEDRLKRKCEDYSVLEGILQRLTNSIEHLKNECDIKLEVKEKQLEVLTHSVSSLQDILLQQQSIQKELSKVNDLQPALFRTECEYLKQIEDLKDKISNMEVEIKFKSECIEIADQKVFDLTMSLDTVRNTINYELYQSLCALENCDSLRQMLSDSSDTCALKYSQLEEQCSGLVAKIESDNDKRNSFFTLLENLLFPSGNVIQVTSFDDALHSIDAKLTEFSELRDHLRNVIHSKVDILSKIKNEVIQNRNAELPSVTMTTTTNLDVSQQSSDSFCEHFDKLHGYFDKLSEIVSLFSLDPVTVDVSNYEQNLDSLKHKFVEFFDLIEHLRNVINSREDQISDLKLKQNYYSNLKAKLQTELTAVKLSNDLFESEKDINNKLISEITSELSMYKASKEKSDEEMKGAFKNILELKEDLELKNIDIDNLQELLKACNCSVVRNQQRVFFFEINEYLSSLGGNVASSDSYDGLTKCLKMKFQELIDLSEHLRNTIQSRDDQIKCLSSSFNSLKHDYENSISHVDDLKRNLSEVTEEIDRFKKKETDTDNFVSGLLDNINTLKDQLVNDSNKFSLRISELEDLKEHMENKIQSKNDQLLKLSEDFSLLSDKFTLKKNKILELAEELSLKIKENDDLKNAEKESLEHISRVGGQLSILKNDFTTKEEDFLNKISDLTCKYNELVSAHERCRAEELSSLEEQLSSVYKELDLYKTNEVMKDASIAQLEARVADLDSSLASKVKEISVSKDNMDNLSQNIVELIRDKEVFFNRLQSIGSIDIKSFDDVLQEFNGCLSELLELRERKQDLEKLDEYRVKKDSLECELNTLKSKYELEIQDLQSKCSDEEVIKDIDGIISDILVSLCESNAKQDDVPLSLFGLKDKLRFISSRVRDYVNRVNSLEEDYEVQLNKNIESLDFAEIFKSDIIYRIEHMSEFICDLTKDMNNLENRFYEALASKDLDIENVQKEVKNTLSEFEECISLNEHLNVTVASLVDACTEVQRENELLASEFSLVVKKNAELFQASDSLLDEYTDIIGSSLNIISDLSGTVCHQTSLNSIEISNLDDMVSSVIDNYSMYADLLLADISDFFKSFINDIKLSDIIFCCDFCDVKELLSALKLNILTCQDIGSLSMNSKTISQDYIRMFELIDSICMENKILGVVQSAFLKVTGESVTDSLRNVVTVTEKGSHNDISLIMSVIDQTVLETTQVLECSSSSLNKAETSSCVVSPERTLYILPDGLNSSDTHIENTLYLPVKDVSSAAVDPLQVDNKTSSSQLGGLLKFDEFSNCLDESVGEFHDAHGSVAETDPFSVSVDDKESHFMDLLTDLRCLLGLENFNNGSDILDAVKSKLVMMKAIQTDVEEQCPDLMEESIEIVFKKLLGRISNLEDKESSLLAKQQALFGSLLTLQTSVSELKKFKTSTVCELEHLYNQTTQDYSNMSSEGEKLIATSLEQHKLLKKNIISLKTEYENFKLSHATCSEKLDTLQGVQKELEKSLDITKLQLNVSLLKCDELSCEKNSLESELNSLKSEYIGVKDSVKELREKLSSKESEKNTITMEMSMLRSEISSMETAFNLKFNKLESEKTSLLAEVTDLKLKMDSYDSLNSLKLDLETKTTKLNNLDAAYNLLRTNYDDMVKQCLHLQDKLEETEKKANDETNFDVDNIIDELRQVLRTLDCNDDFDLKDGLTPTFCKINKRINLLKEYRDVHRTASSSSEVSELTQRIINLERDLQEATDFKYKFSRELQSLKPNLSVDLLKMPLGELYNLMISEIMTREKVIISNLKDEYDRKIVSLKEQINQLEEKDRRRIEWVSEVENDNEQLNEMSKRLRGDIQMTNEKLASKLLCEKLILKELESFERKLRNESPMRVKSSSDDDSDIIRKSEVSGDILTKLQKMSKGFIASDESSVYIEKYKETIKSLEVKCCHLESEINVMETFKLNSIKEADLLRTNFSEKMDCYEKEIATLSNKVKNSEQDLVQVKDKLKLANESHAREQEQLQREKAFSLKTLEENERFKVQLENHIVTLDKMGVELSEAKKSIKDQIAKHENEISSLMKVISDLEGELKLSRDSEGEKGKAESELLEINKHFSLFKEECDSRLLCLDKENKALKNEINLKQREITLLTEEYKHEISKCKNLLSESLEANNLINEKYKSAVSKLESELYEKEALYRDSVSSLMLEKEKDHERIKTLEEFGINSRRVCADLENKLLEQENMYSSLKSSSDHRIQEYIQQLAVMERCNEELNNRIRNIEMSIGEKERAHLEEINILNLEIAKLKDRVNEMTRHTKAPSEFDKSLLKLFPGFSECTTELLSHIKIKLAEIETLKEELEDKQQECVYLEEDSDDLIKQVKGLEKRIGEMGRAQFESEEKYQAELREKSALIAKLQQQISMHTMKFQQFNEEIKFKTNSVAELKQINSDLECKLGENLTEKTRLVEENASLRHQMLQKPPECVDCIQLKDQVIHYKAKLHLKEVKIAELTSKAESASTPLKERNNLIEKYKEKVTELEKENSRLKVKTTEEDRSSTANQEQKIVKLEARIVKLEKDREFLKRLCDKRGSTIQELKHAHDSKK